MENASKALLMAGGVILVMMIIALVIYAWSTFSDFYSSKDELANIENISEFNLQFTNYDRDDVSGYELLSLINKVIDYNQRYSTVGQNDEKYTPIEIDINMGNDLSNIYYELSNTTQHLFTSTTYRQSNTVNILKSSVLDTITNLENNYGKENMQNLSKSIGSIFLDDSSWTGAIYTEEYKSNLKKEAIRKFNSITSSKYANDSYKGYYTTIASTDYNDKSQINTNYNMIKTNFRDAAYKYYEYTQFKKAIFTSQSNQITYDNSSGRISKMVFNFTGKVE